MNVQLRLAISLAFPYIGMMRQRHRLMRRAHFTNWMRWGESAMLASGLAHQATLRSKLP